jgi:hypothetical protein
MTLKEDEKGRVYFVMEKRNAYGVLVGNSEVRALLGRCRLVMIKHDTLSPLYKLQHVSVP